MAHPYVGERSAERARAGRLMGKCGYAGGGMVHGDEAADRAMIGRAIKQHDDQLHGGKTTHLKLARGGAVDGERAREHLAKRARGGATKGGKHTKVQIIVGNPAAEQMARQAGTQQGMQQGAAAGAQLGARAVAQRMAGAGGGAPPPAAAPAGGAPMGGGMPPPGGMQPPGAGPMLRARGGHVPHMTAGAGSGEGRIEKMAEYGTGGFKPKDRMPK